MTAGASSENAGLWKNLGPRLGEEVIHASPSGKRFWHFQGLRLRRPGNDGEGAQLAPDAVWLEPIVQEGRGGSISPGCRSSKSRPPRPRTNVLKGNASVHLTLTLLKTSMEKDLPGWLDWAASRLQIEIPRESSSARCSRIS